MLKYTQLYALPNRRCYGGKLRKSEATKAKRLHPVLRYFIVSEFDVDLGLFSLIENNELREYAEDQYLQIKILAFYNAQKRRLLNGLVDLGKEIGLTANELSSEIHTSDSYQGREAGIIILDTTVCIYNGQGTLGHVGDELKFNIAITRAKECLFVIGNLPSLDSKLLAQQDRPEFVIDLLQELKKRGACKDFASNAQAEKIVDAKLDDELPAKDDGDKGVVDGDMEGDTAVKRSNESVIVVEEKLGKLGLRSEAASSVFLVKARA